MSADRTAKQEARQVAGDDKRLLRKKPAERKGQSIPYAKPNLLGNERQYVREAVASTWISGGAFVDRFESEFAKYCGTRYAVTSSNGTTALDMAFLALSVRFGDEVIVPGFAFMAAANVALHLGATPVFADVDPMTWCMTADEVERNLSPRTKLIVAVHTYGNMCPMDEIMALAESKSIAVVEDAAEAFASRYKGQLAGTRGTLGTFSFHASKTMTTGEGGMVVTDVSELRDRMGLFRNHGMSGRRYWHEVPGYNFRLTNMQAALGCAQLERIDHITSGRKRVFASYQRHLRDVAGVSVQNFPVYVDPCVWAVAVKLDARAYPQGRNQVIEQMAQAGIETRNAFYAASLMRNLYGCGPLPVCEELSEQIISLPTYDTLGEEQIECICAKLANLRV